MNFKRTIKIYKTYFVEFYYPLPEKVKDKIKYVLKYIQEEENIPAKYFKHIINVKGLYEIRVEYEGNIYRIFCCLDRGMIVILFNGFQKKSQKTPEKELKIARKLMTEYFNEQNK